MHDLDLDMDMDMDMDIDMIMRICVWLGFVCIKNYDLIWYNENILVR